ncbi:TonB-dependent receptor [Alteromonas ponticola]|uniref:TonB-dependent receptor n=1 Tax=Alteromonas ponticola TaxID=2720613 RepID=A0ABX1QY11_9ALTE|nr:TonB-dependent receptor [Alteromonas ponticola]NMH59130.1 TonB-dependent receptor [Alteromonas ponticola]
MTKTLISLALSTALTTPTLATEQTGEVITVTAARTSVPQSAIPATVSVITGDEIRAQLNVAQSLSDILGNMIPAFSPSRQKLTSAGETLRGREPLYLIDGVPQSNPLRNGSRAAYTIDPFMIERVEVIHGASAIQGMGASGGIINIITKSAENGPTHEINAGITSSTEAFSDGLTYQTGYLYRHNAGKWQALLGFQLKETGMYVDGEGQLIGLDGAQGDTMDSTSTDLFAKFAYTADEKQSLEFMINRFEMAGNGDFNSVGGNREIGEPTISGEGKVEGKSPENEVITSSLTYRNNDLMSGKLNWQLFLQDFSALYGGGRYATFQDAALGEDLFDQSRNDSQKYGSRITLNWQNVGQAPLDITAGLDYLNDTTFQELAQTGRKWVPDTEFINWAPYLQARYQVGDLSLSAGARYEYGKLKVDDFTTLASNGNTFVAGGQPSFNELLHNLGVVYQITPQLRAYASFSEGFSMPDVGRVLRGINQPDLSVSSFLDLQPVIADNKEVGLDYTFEALSFGLSYFTSDSDLGARLQADDDGIFSVMRERTEIDGFEANASYMLSAQTRFTASYADTDGEYDSDGDQRVDQTLSGRNIAPRRLNISWHQSWTDALYTQVQFSKLFSRDAGEESDINDFNGYHTVNASATYETMQAGTFTLGLENLFNEYYFTYYAQTVGGDTRNFTGRGRTATLSWQYGW